jgi:uncharacterized protein (DUF433 family)
MHGQPNIKNLGVYVRVILKLTSNKYGVKLYNVFKWLESRSDVQLYKTK